MNDAQRKALALARARKRAAEKKPLDLGTALNKAGEAMTFGIFGDEADARFRSFFKGTSYDEELARIRQQEVELERNNPGAALTAEIGGGIMGALIPGAGLGTLARGAGLGKRALASGAVGGAGAGLYSFAEGEGGFSNRVENGREGALFGAGIGAAVPVAGGAIQRILDNRAVGKAVRNAPNAARQRAASGAAYDAFEGAAAEITPDAFNRLRGGLLATLGEGQDALPGAGSLTPKATSLADTVRQMSAQLDGAVQAGQNPMLPLKAVEQLRRRAGDVADDVNAIGRSTADGRLGIAAIDNIDDFVDGLRAADVGIGDGAAAVSALKKARKLWSKSIKTQMLEDIADKQDDYLGGQASAIRNGIGSLLRNKRKSKNFTDAEKAALRKIIGGNGLTRAIRLMGNGIGRQGQMVSGGVLGGLPGMLAGAVTGELSAEVANRNAVRNFERARAAIASGALGQLPKSSQTARAISEGIMRRIAAGQSLPLTP